MIITLCGSARFEQDFKNWNTKLGLQGHSVFSLSAYPSDQPAGKDWYTEEQKIMLDLVHLNKIRVSDLVLVLNRDNYVGSSTAREVKWARMLGKNVIWLERPIELTPDVQYEMTVDDYLWN